MMTYYRLLNFIFLLALVSCSYTVVAPGDSSQSQNPVVNAPIISATPQSVTANRVGFEIQVIPLDQNGNLITGGVTLSDFSFRNITAIRVNNSSLATTATAIPTALDIIAATTGQAKTIVLDFDSSGSMSTNDRDRLRVLAGQQLLTRLDNNSNVAILDFNSRVRLLQDFTNDKTLLQAAIDKVGQSGSTAMYDSLKEALDLLNSSAGRNPTIVLLSDGADNRSRSTFSTIVSQAQSQNTPIYSVGLGNETDIAQLQELAQRTKGAFARVNDAAQLNALFDAIGVGISQGRVVVTGEGTFANVLAAGVYEVQGVLVTAINGGQAETPFSFRITVIT